VCSLLFISFASQDYLTVEQLHMMWQTVQNKHSSIVECSYTLFPKLMQSLKPEKNASFFDKIQSHQEGDPAYLAFVAEAASKCFYASSEAKDAKVAERSYILAPDFFLAIVMKDDASVSIVNKAYVLHFVLLLFL